MNIRTAIEEQREKMDRMALQANDLTQLLRETQKMDRMIEVYENRQANGCRRKDA